MNINIELPDELYWKLMEAKAMLKAKTNIELMEKLLVNMEKRRSMDELKAMEEVTKEDMKRRVKFRGSKIVSIKPP